MASEGMVIRIGGDTSDFEKSLKSVSQSIETLQAKIGARKDFLLREQDITKINQYNREIQAFEGEIKRLQSAGKQGFDELGNSVNRSGNAIGGAYNKLRELAYLLPGVGIGGLVGFGVEGIVALGNAVVNAASKTQKLKESIKDVFETAAKDSGKDLVQLELFRQKLNDVNIPASDRIKIAKEYNKVADETNQIDLKQINNLGLINQKIERQNELIQQRALSMAASSKLTTEGNKYLDAELKFREQLNITGLTQDEVAKAYDETLRKTITSASELRKGLDGVSKIVPLNAPQATSSGRIISKALTDLYGNLKITKSGFDELSKSLSGFITVDGLTTNTGKKGGSVAREKGEFPFFDSVLGFNPEKQGLTPAEQTALLNAVRNYYKTVGGSVTALKDILDEPNRRIGAEEAQQYWKGFKEGFIQERPFRLDAASLQPAEDALSQLKPPQIKLPVTPVVEIANKLAALKSFEDKVKAFSESIRATIEGSLGNVAASFGQGLADAFSGLSLDGAFKNIASVMGDFLQELGKLMIKYAIEVKIFKDTFEKLILKNPLLGIAAGIGLIAIGGAIKNAVLPKPRGFAEGGLVTGRTFAEIGEGVGTSKNNPEVVAPLNKLKDLIGSNSPVINLNGNLRLTRDELIFFLARGGRSQNVAF